MKCLIIYYSSTQNNEHLAHYLRDKLSCDCAKIETRKTRTAFSVFFDLMFNRRPPVKTIPHNLKNYDHIIFIAPIWAGKIATPLQTLLANEKARINSYSFITLCGGGNVNQRDNVIKALSVFLGRAPFQAVELWISELLTTANKNTMKSSYRVTEQMLETFELPITHFLEKLHEKDVA